MSKDPQLKKMDWVAYILSVVVVGLVIVMRMPEKNNFGFDFTFLPPVYSTLNAVVALLLILALAAIKKKNIIAHKRYIIAAMFCSALFLVMYVLYHFTTPETKYCKQGNIRYIYFFFLITHIILAGVILPFILMAFNRGYLNIIHKHKKMVKWVYPLWLYVAITGPIIYLMLKPCYQ